MLLTFIMKNVLRKNKYINIFFCIFLFLGISGNVFSKEITDEAQNIYKKYQNSVYQVQVVDLATGKKSAIGSGFSIDEEGYLATNYHVVSSAVNKPHLYRVELVREDGSTELLSIQNIDVIHDLAIVKSAELKGEYIPLSKADNLQKGTRIFAMGNPHDLGMTIIEGTYNGLMKKSLYEKILFSGSLNPGMSGGPALNHEGNVIGINVATAGNQLSFLVPVKYLKLLYDGVISNREVKGKGWKNIIQQQLFDNQNHYMGQLISSHWTFVPIGQALVPGKISEAFKCWGDTKNAKEDLYFSSYMDCATNDNLFLSNTLSTARIHYRYNWVQSKGLNAIRFYKLYQSYFSYPMTFENADKKDVGAFVCHNNFVTVGGKDWKVALCARNYKRYEKLYDINLSLASVHKKDRGLIIDVAAMGITKENALKFIEKFLKEIQWKE